jgi:hypothetical protein
MEKTKACLTDGQYPCQATLHIKDGKAVVVLHDMFGLEPGSTIPLLRKECNLLVEAVEAMSAARAGILNGHGII